MKNIFTFLIVLVFANLSFAQSLVSGLQACYPLDANADNGSIAGAAMNGTMFSVVAAQGQNSVSSNALYFAGMNSSRVELPASATLKTPTVTVSFWFNADAKDSTQFLVMAPGNCTTQPYAYAVILESFGNDIFIVAASQGSNCAISMALNNNTFIANRWYFVVASFTSDENYIWVDAAAESGPGGVPDYQMNGKVILGGNNSTNDPLPFKGKMDHVRFYNRLLNAGDIALLYGNSGLPCSFITGVSENSVAAMKPAFPNPCTDVLNLDESTSACRILDMNGRCVLRADLNNNNTSINVSSLQTGLYFIESKNTFGNISIQKIAIEK